MLRRASLAITALPCPPLCTHRPLRCCPHYAPRVLLSTDQLLLVSGPVPALLPEPPRLCRLGLLTSAFAHCLSLSFALSLGSLMHSQVFSCHL